MRILIIQKNKQRISNTQNKEIMLSINASTNT
jgi:hypothetical protein